MTILKTKRFELRPPRDGDAARFASLCNDLEIARFTARIPHPYTLDHAEAFLAAVKDAQGSGAEHVFAICEDDILIACAGLSPAEDGSVELGYWVGADHRGQGVASEAGAALIDFAFSALGAPRVTAGYFVDNPGSGRVLEKLGFRKTGETRMWSVGRNCDVDTIRLERLRG